MTVPLVQTEGKWTTVWASTSRAQAPTATR